MARDAVGKIAAALMRGEGGSKDMVGKMRQSHKMNTWHLLSSSWSTLRSRAADSTLPPVSLSPSNRLTDPPYSPTNTLASQKDNWERERRRRRECQGKGKKKGGQVRPKP